MTKQFYTAMVNGEKTVFIKVQCRQVMGDEPECYVVVDDTQQNHFPPTDLADLTEMKLVSKDAVSEAASLLRRCYRHSVVDGRTEGHIAEDSFTGRQIETVIAKLQTTEESQTNEELEEGCVTCNMPGRHCSCDDKAPASAGKSYSTCEYHEGEGEVCTCTGYTSPINVEITLTVKDASRLHNFLARYFFERGGEEAKNLRDIADIILNQVSLLTEAPMSEPESSVGFIVTATVSGSPFPTQFIKTSLEEGAESWCMVGLRKFYRWSDLISPRETGGGEETPKSKCTCMPIPIFPRVTSGSVSVRPDCPEHPMVLWNGS